MNASAPLAFAFGVYTAEPQSVTAVVPFRPCVVTEQVIGSLSPSLQFREKDELVVSSLVMTDVPAQTGASGMQVTVILTVPISEAGGIPLSVPI